MKINRAHLIEKIEMFRKLAGELKVPEAVLKEASDFIVGCWCHYFAIYAKERVSYLSTRPKYRAAYDGAKLIYGMCRQLSSNYNPELGTIKQILINPIDQPYITHRKPVMIGVSLVVDEHKDKNIATGIKGYWQPEPPTPKGEVPPKIIKIGTVVIAGNFDNDASTIHDIDQLQDRIADLRTTTKHELQHFVQEYLAPYAGKAGYGGVPSAKVKDTAFYPEGQIRTEPTEEQIPMFDLKDTDGRVYHELRDIEFYPRLSDAIESFASLQRHLPVLLHHDLAQAFVGQMPASVLTAKIRETVTKLVYDKYYWKPEYIKYDPDTYKKIGDEIVNELRWFKSLLENRLPDRLFMMLQKYQPLKYGKACAVFMQRVNV